MRRRIFALRVPPALLAEARKAAESEGVALNQLIILALAEKVSAMRTEEYFESVRSDQIQLRSAASVSSIPQSRATNFREALFGRRTRARSEVGHVCSQARKYLVV
jgi:pyridoxine/pyridoxamine 5'-phosphate oxidase